MSRSVLLSIMVAVFLLSGTAAMAAETVSFEPVRAPSKGPDKATVTVIEIADVM